jgi:hypothetical protein
VPAIEPFIINTVLSGTSAYKVTGTLKSTYNNYLINSIIVLYNGVNVTTSMIITPRLPSREPFTIDKLLRGRNYTINVKVTSPTGIQTTVTIMTKTPLRGGKRKTRKIKKSRKLSR